MSLSLKEVEHIAALARLELTAKEKEKYRIQLSAILDHIQQLSRVDTANLTFDDAKQTDSRLREDDITPSLPPADILSNAKHQRHGQFVVPGIFKDPDA